MVQFDPSHYEAIEGDTVSLSIVLNFEADRNISISVTTNDASALGTYA